MVARLPSSEIIQTAYITGVRRDGDIQLESDSDQGLVLTQGETYFVQSNDKLMQMSDVMVKAHCADEEILEMMPGYPDRSVTLPQPGYTLSSDGYMICKNLSGTRNPENPKYWEFQATFSSEVDNNTGQAVGTEPETWVPVRKTMFENVQRIRYRDVNGKAFVNGAGTSLGYLEIEEELLKWQFTQFEPATVTDEVMATRHRSINNGVYKTLPAYTLMLKVENSEVGFFYGQARRKTTYSLTYDRETWLDFVQNVGPEFTLEMTDGSFQSFPYVYYIRDVEGPNDDIVIQERGPLGTRYLDWSGTGKPTVIPADGEPKGGFQEVTTADGETTFRAKKPERDNGEGVMIPDDELNYIQFSRYPELDFSTFLRL